MLVKGLVRVMEQGRKSVLFLEFVMLVDSRLQDEEISGTKRKKLIVRS